MNVNDYRILTALFASGTLVLSAQAQSFVNLNFEQATVPTSYTAGDFVHLSWSSAAPGWSHNSIGDDTSYVYYGSRHLGISQCYLIKDKYSPYYAAGLQLAGNYSLSFCSGYAVSYDGSGGWLNAYISQTGAISSTANSLWMLATGPFEVYLNGVAINMVSQGGNSYAGDITGFAGTTSELKIANTTGANDFRSTDVDNIRFSTVVVPEPSALAILGLGAIALRLARAKR
jgi:hypothetical protein